MLIKDMLLGYYETQCIYIVAKLNIADCLQDSPKSITEIADFAQVRINKIYRVMRFLAAKGIFDELPNQFFQVNSESRYLLSSSAESLKNFIYLHGEYFNSAASELINSLKSEKSAFELKFNVLSSDYFKNDKNASQIYNMAMKENSEVASKLIVDAYDFSKYKMIVDIGGGIGSLLANILLQNKDSCGINFDIPDLENQANNYFKEKGLLSRCKYLGGDFLKEIPAGGDLYLMKAVLHGKSDAVVEKVLNCCKNIIPTKTKLLSIERVMGTKSDKSYINSCVNDINMLNVTQGSVRSLDEYENLFAKSGYKINKIYTICDDLVIMELCDRLAKKINTPN